jgi:formate dehydrogenase subunit gamma
MRLIGTEFFYNVVVDGHNPVPTIPDVKDPLTIAVAFVGLREYVAGYHRARRTWDEREAEWAAYHPAQRLFWWAQLGLFALLAFTGFTMYDRIATDPLSWVGWLGVPAAWLAPEVQLQLHIFFALALTAAVIMHIYVAVLPSNWDVLTSVLTGNVETYVIRDGRAPSDRRLGIQTPDESSVWFDGQETEEGTDD